MASYDFKEFFSSLPVSVSGHTQTAAKTKAGEEAVHVFRFIRRCDLNLQPGQELVTTYNDPAHPHDIVMLNKHYLASPAFSQDAQVFCPAAYFDKLAPGSGRHLSLSSFLSLFNKFAQDSAAGSMTGEAAS